MIFTLLFSLAAFADLPPADCNYSGEGVLYVMDSTSGKFKPVPSQSYRTTLSRHPLGSGRFQFQQKKTFADGRTDQLSSFVRFNFVGSYEISSPDGKLVNRGYCPRPGHCFGTTKSPSFEGRFVLDYDSAHMRVVNTPFSGEYFVEEFVEAAGGNCPF